MLMNHLLAKYYTYLDVFLYSLITLVPILLCVAFFTLAERKILGGIQRRKGPNQVGYWGFLQPFADGLKLIVKELVFPSRVNKLLFILSPALTLFLSFLGWIAISFDFTSWIINLNNSFLFNFIISSFGIYGILFSCWSSNCKYALLAGLRVVAQMISYEVFLSIVILPIFAVTGSLNLNEIVYFQALTGWNLFFFWPLALIFFIAILAETNRVPFDLVEAEAELVAGYNVEYSGIAFTLFFIGEYANILQMSSWFVLFFLGGHLTFSGKEVAFDFFSVKVVAVAFLFIWIRGTLPRIRFDQLMIIGWKILLPLALSLVIFYCSILLAFNGLRCNFTTLII